MRVALGLALTDVAELSPVACVKSSLVDSTARAGSAGLNSSVTVSLGPAFAGRLVVIGFFTTGGVNAFAGTIGGVAAEIFGASGSTGAVAVAVVPLGATASFVIASLASTTLHTDGVVALANAASAAVVDYVTLTGSSGSVDVLADGSLVAYSGGASAGVWTGATELLPFNANGDTIASFDNVGALETQRSVSYSTGSALIVVSFSPVGGSVGFFANSGGSSPLYSGNVSPHGFHVPSTGKTWLAWEGYNGVYRTEQVTVLDENLGTWTPVVDGIISGSINNDHPNPSICRDSAGYVHMFSGHHPFPLAHAVTKNPDDPSAWVLQPPVTGTGATSPAAYPHCYNVAGTLYLFLQGATWSQIILYVSTSIVNGVVTWAAPITLLDYGGGAGTTGNRAYQGNGVVRGTKICFAQTYSDVGDTKRLGAYYWEYDTATGNILNLGESVVTTPASFPVLKATLDASYLVVADVSGATTDVPAINFDANGNVIIVHQDLVSSNYTLYGSRFAGGVLGSPTVIDSDIHIMSPTIVPLPDGSVDVYYGKTNALNLDEGDIWKRNLSGSGTWGTAIKVQAGGAVFVLGEPDAVLTPGKGRLVWSESTSNPAAPSGRLRLYLNSDQGLVRRTAASLPSPRPGLTVPTVTWDSATKSGNMNVYGNNLLANPGAATTTYPSPTSSNNQVRSTTSYSAGQKYVEFIIQQSQVPSANSSGFGVADASHSGALGIDAHSLAMWGDNLYINNVTTFLGGDLTNWPQGTRFAMAIDFGAQLVWFRNLTTGGNWNNNPSANPATGAGGISFAVIGSGPFFLACEVFQEQDGIILIGGQFPNVGPMPAGFSQW